MTIDNLWKILAQEKNIVAPIAQRSRTRNENKDCRNNEKPVKSGQPFGSPIFDKDFKSTTDQLAQILSKKFNRDSYNSPQSNLTQARFGGTGYQQSYAKVN